VIKAIHSPFPSANGPVYSGMRIVRQVYRQRRCLAVGLSLAAGLLLSPGPRVQAVESNQVASVTSWQGASFPVENFQQYTSPFGYRSSPSGDGGTQFHRGLDMAAPEGSYIRSWWMGRVVEVSDNSACGTSVVIQSGEWEHVYCHMQGSVEHDASGRAYMIDRGGGVQIWEGQAVPAGGRIGRVGMTGRTTGPHLHWGLKYARQWVDPALVLRAMYAEQSQQQLSSRPQL
jgi:murein DD-endopeptidase MepM/ murein hydrolase activator NlpD